MTASTRPELVMSRSKGNQRVARYSFPATPYPHSLLINLKKYDYKNLDARYVAKTRLESQGKAEDEGQGQVRVDIKEQASIELPFPSQITDSVSLNITNLERDPIVDTIARTLAGGVDTNQSLYSLPGDLLGAAGKIGNQVYDVFKSIGAGEFDGSGAFQDALSGITDVLKSASVGNAAQAATYLLSSLDPSIGQAVSQITGKSMNPRETLAFQGVNLKTFEFSWSLFPSNAQDSQQIKEIIATLKRNALPTTESLSAGENGAGISRLFLNYPAIAELTLIGVDPSFYPRFKPCMIDNVSINYSGGNAISAIIKGGKPAAIDISISFREMSIETAEDVEGGFEALPEIVATAENPGDGNG